MYPHAMINPTSGKAPQLRTSEEKVILLNALAMKGKTPICAVRESTNISLILKGSRGKNLMILGKKRMIEKVAANVS